MRVRGARPGLGEYNAAVEQPFADRSDVHGALAPALDTIARRDFLAAGAAGGWSFATVGGGANNRLYRLQGPHGNLAAKFTLRDGRDRAGREYAALRALAEARLDVAPRPLHLEPDRYALPLVVQSWLDGPVRPQPPEDDASWQRLLANFAAVHTVTPENASVPLRQAVLTMASAADGQSQIQDQLERIPASERPAAMRELVRGLVARRFPDWPTPTVALCRCDPNTTNFIRRQGAWASVDWENAGWGDPAFELADLLTHPVYEQVSAERRRWLVAVYCAMPPHAADPGMAERIAVYEVNMLAWWTVRMARSLYEVPRRLDERLVARPAAWQTRTQGQYERWLARAKAALDAL